MEKMEENKYETTTMNIKINEVYAETEIIQYYKNTLKSSIELSIKLPILKNCQINKFIMTIKKSVISRDNTFSFYPPPQPGLFYRPFAYLLL